jgi:fucose 4-O-acetylase-like acetyltransferase
MDGRVKHIDIAKGISIFLVAMAHGTPVFVPLVSSKVIFYYQEVIGPISLFRLPLFFFLSGIFLPGQ